MSEFERPVVSEAGLSGRPILFSAPMVRAILDGRKTQTRRLAIKTSQPDVVVPCDFDKREGLLEIENRHSGQHSWKPCPYGRPGERLWVRETFFDTEPFTGAPLFAGRSNRIAYRADGEFIGCHKWKPSIHMPRHASRIYLEITDIRVERLQEISEADAIAEGVEEGTGDFAGCFSCGSAMSGTTAKECYGRLWESINGPGSWGANPWVWVVGFRRLPG